MQQLTVVLRSFYGIVEEVLWESNEVYASIRHRTPWHDYDAIIPLSQFPLPWYKLEQGVIFEVTILNDNLKIDHIERKWTKVELDKAKEWAEEMYEFFNK